jgi:hypothetical protein
MTKTTLTELINDPDATNQPGEQLYIFRDDEAVFYVGQSQMGGGARAYEHWCGGFRANDRLNEFLRAAVADGLDLIVEFWSVDDCKAIDSPMEIYGIDDAEHLLIAYHCPAFNTSGAGKRSASVPARYITYHAKMQERRERMAAIIRDMPIK